MPIENRVEMIIRPRHDWELIDLPELWRFRDLLRTLASRDLKLRYRQTVFGLAWDLMQTLVPVTIFSMIVGGVGKVTGVTVPYFLFAFVGFVGWNAFSNTLTKASNSVVQDAHLLLRVYFPRLILPLATMGSTAIDIGINLAVFPILLAAFRFTPPVAILLTPVWLALLALLAVAVGLYLSAIMVQYRDVKYAVPVLMQFWFYASPVAYPIPALPHSLRPWFHLNPMASVLEGLRWSLLGTERPDPFFLALSLLLTTLFILLGLLSFNRMQRRFADVV